MGCLEVLIGCFGDTVHLIDLQVRGGKTWGGSNIINRLFRGINRLFGAFIGGGSNIVMFRILLSVLCRGRVVSCSVCCSVCTVVCCRR